MNTNRKHRDNVVELSATHKRTAQTKISDTEDSIGLGDTQSQRQAAVAIVPERRWAIECTDTKLRNHLRERFERLVAQAIEVELRIKYQYRFQAVDAWLDLLSRETRFSHGRKISLLLTASAECCEELKLRALTTEQPGTAEIWAEIERQLRALIAESPGDELYAIDDRAGTPSTVECPDLESTSGAAEPNRSADRRAMVDAYIKEVWEKTGKRISRADIWRVAGDKSRAEFERWESYFYEKRGRKTNVSAAARFTRILDEKPHLNIFHAYPRISTPYATPCVEPDTAIGTAKQLSQEKLNAITRQRSVA